MVLSTGVGVGARAKGEWAVVRAVVGLHLKLEASASVVCGMWVVLGLGQQAAIKHPGPRGRGIEHAWLRIIEYYSHSHSGKIKAAGTVSPPRGGRRILSAIEVVSASRSMVYIAGRSRVFIPFYVPCNHVRRKDRC